MGGEEKLRKTAEWKVYRPFNKVIKYTSCRAFRITELQSSHRSIPGWSCSLAADITSLCLGWQYFSRSLDASLCSPTVWLSRALTSAPQVAGRVTFFSQCLSTSRRQVESFPCFSMLSRVPTGTRSFSPTSYHLERHSWISSLTSTRSSNVSTSEGKTKGGHRHWRILTYHDCYLWWKAITQCAVHVQCANGKPQFNRMWVVFIDSYHSV